MTWYLLWGKPWLYGEEDPLFNSAR